MIAWGAISFASPWILLAGLSLPVIWLLLRMTPPAVTHVRFPAIRLLFGLDPTERTPARTPWWLVALRMLIAALIIAALAEPILNAQRLAGQGPVVVVLDNGWGAAGQWTARVNAARDILEAADLRRRPVALLTTAATPRGETPPTLAATDARDALARLTQIEPRAWPADLGALIPTLQQASITGGEVFWISDGILDAKTPAFTQALQRLGSLSVIHAPRGAAPLVLAQPQRTTAEGGTARIEIRVRRIVSGADRADLTTTVRASDSTGAVLAQANAVFKASSDTAVAVFALPTELANRIARFDIANHAAASATALADDRWQQRPVGLFSAAVAGTTAPLLEDGFYLAQAFGQSADIRTGSATELLARPLSMLVVSGGQRLTDEESEAIASWVDKGGLLVRFAGARLEPTGDKLLPVRLRSAGRNLGGAMSWGEPAGLGTFPDKSPFKQLPIPDDVRIKTQILAEPSADLPDKTWARLADGTPLITAARRGNGWIVLFHVTSTPEWSNLPLSGLFVGMLHRLLDLSQGVAASEIEPQTTLPPLSLLDGLGRAVPPGPTSVALPADSIAALTASADAPPGLYGTERNKAALNLGPGVWTAQPIETWPAGVATSSLDGVKSERGLKPWILLAALLLLLGDLALSLIMRGLAPGVPKLPVRATAAVLVIVCAVALSGKAIAADKPLDPDMVEAVLQTRLGYVATGSDELDRIARAGLSALTGVLAGRTSAEMAEPAEVSLDDGVAADKLIPYPLLYWRVVPNQPLPSSTGFSAINEYLRHGGMIVFDAPDQVGAIGADTGTAGAGSRLREILARIDMPPVVPLDNDHVLTRSFYLVQGLPGRYAGGVIYVERGGGANDGVSSVIIGAHDWAAAWARDAKGLPLYPVVPGGEQQREMAYRSGVNMVMYALTGNYKADQVHLPAIMQRLTQ